MTRLVIGLCVVWLAGVTFAQTPATLGDSAKRVVGSWEFSNADRDRTCTATLKSDPAPGGLKIEFDTNCANLFPLVRAPTGSSSSCPQRFGSKAGDSTPRRSRGFSLISISTEKVIAAAKVAVSSPKKHARVRVAEADDRDISLTRRILFDGMSNVPPRRLSQP